MGLFVRGELPDEERPAAAVIGARNCTNYGKQEAEYMAAELAKAGVQIISGLAYGIDGAGHRGAMKAGGEDIRRIGVRDQDLLSAGELRTLRTHMPPGRCSVGMDAVGSSRSRKTFP